MKNDVLDEAPPSAARFERDTDVAQLVEVLASVYVRMNSDIETLRESRMISSATGLELDRKAREVDIDRPTGEDDDTFRLRALAGRRRARSETRWEDFAKGALQFLDADPNDIELEVDYDDELGAVIVNVNSQVISDSPFTESTIQTFLEEMISMSRRVVIRTVDGFQFSDPDTTDEKSGSGWGEGQWTE